MPTDFRITVRAYLRMTSENATDSDIDTAVVLIKQQLFAVGQIAHSVGSYAAVSADDLPLFDQVIALMSAAWLRPFLPKQEASGEVVKWVSGTDSYSWSQPTKDEEQLSIEQRWLNMAWETLGCTQALNTTINGISDVSVGLTASGRRRNRPSFYTIGSPIGIRVNPLIALWGDWVNSHGIGVGWSWLGPRT